MKLSTKITVGAAVFLLLFSQIFSIWSLDRQRENLMETTEEYEDAAFWKNFRSYSILLYENHGALQSESAGRTAAVAAFRECFDSSHALYLEGEEEALYNQTPYTFSVQETLDWLDDHSGENQGNPDRPVTSRGNYRMYREIGERQLLILAQTGEMGTETFWVFHYADITGLNQKIEQLFLQGLGMALGLAVLMAVFLSLVIRRLLRHFRRLKAVSEKIAGGDYSQRTEIHTRDEVGEVAAGFDQMAEQVQRHIEELDAVNEKQKLLLGSLAHEMKTPMMSILGYAQSLQRLTLTKEQQEKALGYIESEGRRLSALSAKMMELTGLYQADGKMEWKEIDAGEFLENGRGLVREQLKEKQVSLAIEMESPGLLWKGDPDLLSSVLRNLIDNACRVSEAGQKILVRGRKDGFSVEDFGCGIPEEEIKRVTEAFYMVDKARTRKAGGAGLGLAICQEIARAHGGHLEIASTVGQGTTVSFLWNSDGKEPPDEYYGAEEPSKSGQVAQRAPE